MKIEDVRVGLTVRIVKSDDTDCFTEGYIGETGKIAGIDIDDHTVLVKGLDTWFDFSELDPLDPLECLEEGQILYSDISDTFIKILVRLGSSGELTTYAASPIVGTFDDSSLNYGGGVWTVCELKLEGYKPYHPEAEETNAEKEAMKLLKDNGYKITKE